MVGVGIAAVVEIVVVVVANSFVEVVVAIVEVLALGRAVVAVAVAVAVAVGAVVDPHRCTAPHFGRTVVATVVGIVVGTWWRWRCWSAQCRRYLRWKHPRWKRRPPCPTVAAVVAHPRLCRRCPSL